MDTGAKLKNLFSFSIYGSISKYNVGAIENARFISQLGPSWSSIFYFDDSVPPETIRQLEKFGAITKRIEQDWHTNGMFWRFRVARDLDFERMLVRDVDSRISKRELSAISSWIDSGKTFHIMRDHPNHRTPMLGGMWGASRKIKDYDYIWSSEKEYGNSVGEDQRFLRENLYTLAKNDACIHDSFFRFEKDRSDFPARRVNSEYVGESVDENGEYDRALRLKLSNIENSHLRRLFLMRPQINL